MCNSPGPVSFTTIRFCPSVQCCLGVVLPVSNLGRLRRSPDICPRFWILGLLFQQPGLRCCEISRPWFANPLTPMSNMANLHQRRKYVHWPRPRLSLLVRFMQRLVFRQHLELVPTPESGDKSARRPQLAFGTVTPAD